MPARPLYSVLIAASAATAIFAMPAAAGAAATVILDSDATPYADQVAHFTADVFNATGAKSFKWAVDCPTTVPYDFSAATSTGPANTFSTTFTTVGTHSLCVQLTDADSTDVDRISFEIQDEVDPGPTAGLVVTPATAVPGQVVTLDASSSTNAVPGPLKYEFDADGDSSNGYEVDNGANPIYQRSYAASFNGSVGVSVTDRNFKSSSKSEQLLVATPPVFTPPVGSPGGPPAVNTGNGPLGAVSFTNEPCTINQFLVGGLVVKLIWGEVYAKSEVTYSLIQSKKVKKKGKTKTVKTLLKIVTAKDDVFYSPGSSWSRPAQGKAAAALRKLKSAKVLVTWKVTSKAGDSKKGEATISMKKGL